MKSILLLTNAYPDFEGSYRGIFIRKMAVLLKGQGYRIYVVTPKIYSESFFYEKQDGIEIYRFPFMARGKLLIEHEGIPYLKMVLYFLSGMFLTAYVLFRNGCDLIHAHWAVPTGVIGAILAGLMRKPLVVTVHGSDLRMAVERRGLIHRLFRYVCRTADHVHCVSVAQAIAVREVGIPDERVSIFPMGVETRFIEYGKNRGETSSKRSPIVLSNRNLQPIYNISLLIQAIPFVLEKISDVKFLIAGDGPQRQNLEKDARALGIAEHVQFLGRVPPEEMPRLLKEADIYVSTSLYDGTSVSLLEAMASGCFPVVSDIPANREWIRDGGNGLLFPVDNAQALAERILVAIRNSALVEKGRERNLHTIEKKALWSVCLKNMKDIYEDQLRIRSWEKPRS